MTYDGDQPSDETAAGLFRKIGRAAAGIMDTSDGVGNEVHVHSKDPTQVGRTVRFDYEVDDSIWTPRQLNEDGSKGVL